MDILTPPRSRRIIKEECRTNRNVLKMLARHYTRLKLELCSELSINCSGATEEDVFNDTFILVAHEKNIEEKSESELLEHFRHRFKMMQFRTVQEDRTMKRYLNMNARELLV